MDNMIEAEQAVAESGEQVKMPDLWRAWTLHEDGTWFVMNSFTTREEADYHITLCKPGGIFKITRVDETVVWQNTPNTEAVAAERSRVATEKHLAWVEQERERIKR